MSTRQQVLPWLVLNQSCNSLAFSRTSGASAPGSERPYLSPKAIMPPERAPQLQPPDGIAPMPTGKPEATLTASAGSGYPRISLATHSTASEHRRRPLRYSSAACRPASIARGDRQPHSGVTSPTQMLLCPRSNSPRQTGRHLTTPAHIRSRAVGVLRTLAAIRNNAW